MIGLKEIGAVAAEIEAKLRILQISTTTILRNEKLALLDALVTLEATIADIRLTSSEFDADAEKLFEESFEHFPKRRSRV